MIVTHISILYREIPQQQLEYNQVFLKPHISYAYNIHRFSKACVRISLGKERENKQNEVNRVRRKLEKRERKNERLTL
jgi:hypothetical protein